MTRAEFRRRLHAARVEAYARALEDTGVVPTTAEQRRKFTAWHLESAERRVTEYEGQGVFRDAAESERVA